MSDHLHVEMMTAETDALTRSIEIALGGDYEGASKTIPPLGATSPPSYKHLCVNSLLKVALSQYKEALDDANVAGRMSFGNTAHIACQIMALSGLKKFKEAKEALDIWRIRSPDDPLSRGDISALVGESKSSSSGVSKIDWDRIAVEGLPSDLEVYLARLFANLTSLDDDSAEQDDTNIKTGDREESNRLKQEGNAKYKLKQFDEALRLYNEALAADPTNVDVYNNISAVSFETNEYEKCISECENAISIARRLMAEYRIVARSYSRMGKAFMKLEKYNDAISCFEKSLTEHRTQDVADALKEAKKHLEEQEKQSYLDPALSEEYRAKGNECFKKGLYPEAISHYNEALKRNFNDPKVYSNRAACYIKLMAFREAEKDCDAALKLDPTFPRARIRKAQVLHAKHEYMESLDILIKLTEEDKEGIYTAEIAPLMANARRAIADIQSSGGDSEAVKRAMQNPEVQRIISDPVMQTVLKQIAEDRNAFEEHIKDPQIAKNIRTLINAGVIQLSPH